MLLLAAVLLAAFYPATRADFARIDDSGLRDALEQSQGWNLLSLFAPPSGGSYYRPLLIVTFVLDKHLGLYPGLMHLENIVLHLICAALVYFLAEQLITSATPGTSLLPLVAALLFGLHPINSESVNWISGRTDILAGVFIYSSALLLLRFRQCHSKKYMWFSLIAFLCGVLSKETALAFLPAFLLLMAPSHEEASNGIQTLHRVSVKDHASRRALFVTGAITIVLIVFALRISTLASHENRIGITARAISADWIHSLLVSLQAFGFYIKKLLMPFPLNFAIMDVDPLYEILGVPLLALCIFSAVKRTSAGSLFLVGVCLIAPSFILAFNQIAWTPYAERYVYIASGFMILSGVIFIHESIAIYPRWLKIGVIVLLTAAFISGVNRSIVWRDDLTICRDTVEKSPMARSMRVTYAGVLADNGDYSEALKQLKSGRAIPHFGYDERVDLGTAYVFYKQGRIDEAISLSEAVFRKTHGRSAGALKALMILLTEKLQSMKNQKGRTALNGKIYEYGTDLFKMNNDPLLLFQLAQTAGELGENEKAVELFRQSIRMKSDDDLFKLMAMNRIHRCSSVSHGIKR